MPIYKFRKNYSFFTADLNFTINHRIKKLKIFMIRNMPFRQHY